MKNTIWRNNKTGNYYEILHVAKHSETLEDLIIYFNIDEFPAKVWVRPYDLFFQKFTKVEK